MVWMSAEYEKEKLYERLSRLSKGVAVIRVGGITEYEIREKDRVEDVLNAVRSSVQEGIVGGGGSALLWAYKMLKIEGMNNDQCIGIEIVRNAIIAPIKQLIVMLVLIRQ